MGERSSGGRFPARRGQAHTGSRWVPVGNSCIGQESGGSILTGVGDRNKSTHSVTMPQQRRVSSERIRDMESVNDL
ncbi:hypothetical protein J5N97_014724 [Dioscorea zingiberensis]|uniref:Uncharacterized protein n=1 Tax=Dioscorea zingiberensis TaxID=325984 RepID=A0A9D5CSY1_9LILI|nr:hypothetical protein J5N97_014724 [Dioscorea zingiberensis]